MAEQRDYYEILGLSRTATSGEIAAAYRKLAIQCHPDKNPGDVEAVERFKEAAEAFEILSDDEKRARYDRYGHAGVQGGARQFNDVGDIFEAFGDIFGDGLFGSFFGGGSGGGRRRRARRGEDIRCDVTLELPEAAKGCSKDIQFRRSKKCSDCNGSGAKPGSVAQACSYCGGHGQVVQSAGILRVQTTCPSCRGAGSVIHDPCQGCGGSGYATEVVKRRIAVPAGVDDGMKVRIPGEGNPSPSGGPPGDCYCFVSVRPHPLFHREGPHLICSIPITYSQATLGATLEVPTLDGRRDLPIPAGTQAKEVFRLPRLGVPDVRNRGASGDLLVQVELEVPKKLSERQEELLRELAEEEHANVSEHRKSFFEKVRDFFIPDDLPQPTGSEKEV